MTRHIVWACFGVDADSPEQAKKRIELTMPFFEANPFNVNATVFVSPAFDRLIGAAIKKAKKGE